MGQLDPGHLRHSLRLGDEVSLLPESLGHESDRGFARSGYCNAVTHGAGSAAASMTVRRDYGVTVGQYRVEQFWPYRYRGVALVGDTGAEIG